MRSSSLARVVLLCTAASVQCEDPWAAVRRSLPRALLGRASRVARGVAEGSLVGAGCPNLSVLLDVCSDLYHRVVGKVKHFGEFHGWVQRFCCGLAQQSVFSDLIKPKEAKRHSPSKSIPLHLVDAASQVNVLISYSKGGTQLLQGLFGFLRSHLKLESLPLRANRTSWLETIMPSFGPDQELAAASRLPYFHGWASFLRPTDWQVEAFPTLLGHIANPVWENIIDLNKLVRASGRIVHIVRKPVDMVVSSYLYNKKSHPNYVWLAARQPPSCLDCDDAAWLQIFKRCNYTCSYSELLQNLSISEGLHAELLLTRSRIKRMLHTSRQWHTDRNILQLRLDSIETNFSDALRCIVRFLSDDGMRRSPFTLNNTMGAARLQLNTSGNVFSTNLDRLIEASHAWPLDKQRFVRKSVHTHPLFAGSKEHITPAVHKRIVHDTLRSMQGTWNRFLVLAGSLLDEATAVNIPARLYGCPTVSAA